MSKKTALRASAVFFLLVLGFFFAINKASATVVPTISFGSTASNYVQTIISGDPNAAVSFSYYPSGASSPITVSNFGTTDSNGYFYYYLNLNTYNVQNGMRFYITINGVQSATITYQGTGTSTSLSLSQTNLLISAGKYIVINASNGSGLTASSNSSAASASISGNSIIVTGNSVGSATINVCSSNLGCAPIYVTVTVYEQTSGNSLALNQANVVMALGQSLTVNAYNGATLSSVTSNNSPAGATVNGSTLTITGNNYGTATLNVCSYNYGCASVSVTVREMLALSQTNVTLSAGQSLTVNSGNGTGLSATSDSSAASASASGNSVAIYGSSAGSATINVCSINLGCAPIFVTVQGYTSNNLSLSQTNAILYAGQSLVIYAYNGNNLSASSNNSSVSAAINGNQVTLTGNSIGNATVNVCSANAGCAYVYVTVQNNSSATLALSQTSVSLTPGQSVAINSSNGSGSYANSSNSSAATASVNGSSIYIYGNSAGSATINVCSANAGCAYVYVTVQSYNTPIANPTTPAANPIENRPINLPDSIIFKAGKTENFEISGYLRNNHYYISNNSNSGIVSASIRENILTLKGLRGGMAKINIGNGAGQYKTITVTIELPSRITYPVIIQRAFVRRR